MVASELEDIWNDDVQVSSAAKSTVDTPLADRSSSSPVARTSKAASDALFLPDLDEIQGSAAPPRQGKDNLGDMDALFDLAHEELSLKPALDLNALRKEADARASLSVVQAYGTTGSEGIVGQSASKREADEKAQKTKIVPKLDDERLLGEHGFPALIKEAKSFKISGKGHELQDLTRLLYMYQLWGHKMFPKLQFRETVERVEKLSRSHRMQAALSGYRDADKEAGQLDVEGESDADVDHNNSNVDNPNLASETGQETSSSRPMSPISQMTIDAFDIDLDSLLKEAESHTLPTDNTTEVGIDGDEPMNELEHRTPGDDQNSVNLLEDEDMWNVVREFEAQETPTEIASQHSLINNSSNEANMGGTGKLTVAPVQETVVGADSEDDLYVD